MRKSWFRILGLTVAFILISLTNASAGSGCYDAAYVYCSVTCGAETEDIYYVSYGACCSGYPYIQCFNGEYPSPNYWVCGDIRSCP